MITLDRLAPFSPVANALVDTATLRLCPFYMLGFTSFVKSMTSLCMIAIAGNAVLYGAVFRAASAVVALGVALFKKRTARG
jgi:hypothetical protein